MIVIDLQSGQEPFEQTRARLSKIPQIIREASDDWGNNYLRQMMLRSAIDADINSVRGASGLYGNINWNPLKEDNTGYLTIMGTGVMLDGMVPHWVNIRRDRPNLLNWALQSGNPEIVSKAREIQEGKRDKFAIYVKPHPFIRRGFLNARRILPEVLKANIETANI